MLIVLGSFVVALAATAVLAIHAPVEMPSRLFAAGLSFVPVWVAMGFVAIALRQDRYRIIAFVVLTGVSVALVATHMGQT